MTNEVEHVKRERDISAAVRAEVLERDRRQCQICGTTGDNVLQLHHWRDFRSQGGGHTPDNLVTLCWKHHEAVHRREWDISVVEVFPGQWSTFPRRLR